MKILVLNCGSSSIRFQFFDLDKQCVPARGIVEKIGMKGSFMRYFRDGAAEVRFEGEVLDHKSGVDYILGVLLSSKHGCIRSLEVIDAVGHRVVHGGERFKGSVLITDDVILEMEKCVELAPLHNPPNLKGIYAIKHLIPDVPQVGVFDTAFHQSMPQHAFMYAIPYALYKKYGVRRYGFHGTSHSYVAQRCYELLGLSSDSSKIVSCHLGGGASVCAIKDGKSVDTSMGFTPVEGLIMGTRSGDIDMGAVSFIMDKEGIGTKSATDLFNKHSGLLGISGISSDARDIESAALEQNNERAILAMRMFDYRVKKYIGALSAAMGGIDALVFTGGIGENADMTRAGICRGLEFFGIEIDGDINKGLRGKEMVISKSGSRVKVVVIPTSEELVIAQEARQILSGAG